ncbi:hypothetical protein [Rhizobium laguerreae]|uniref:hypothetical protein n=1 Tax=Rhizobium laguerreae TaxID=1076926 RepID=UPI001C904669|nr:hypothetical protein [Rhizobium laguerreae]MBY3389192.1 hypothetical protein [Rhizobium laguerreae]MBY3402943.1 hypothetical protein [Rhizobium laguerreae]MBY3409882.1 hypothetical protein [Rhizobium laguerreae]
MELTAFASAASKEASGIVKLVTDLITLREQIKSAIDKKNIRKIIENIRSLYFDENGIWREVKSIREIDNGNIDALRDSVNTIKEKYYNNIEAVEESIKQLQALKAKDNLDIEIDVFQYVWKVSVGKGKFYKKMGSVLDYALEYHDLYGNFPRDVRDMLLAMSAEIEKLNTEIKEVDKLLREGKK